MKTENESGCSEATGQTVADAALARGHDHSFGPEHCLYCTLARIERLEAALRRVQWCIYVEEPHSGSSFLCPECDQVEARGHAPDCLIGAALEVAATDSAVGDGMAGDVPNRRSPSEEK